MSSRLKVFRVSSSGQFVYIVAASPWEAGLKFALWMRHEEIPLSTVTQVYTGEKSLWLYSPYLEEPA